MALPIAVVAFVALTALSSCDKYDQGPVLDDVEALYMESCGLKGVSSDSIQRFATKVQTYVNSNPQVQNNPDYYSILGNIEQAAQTYGLIITITFDDTWDGDTTICF